MDTQNSHIWKEVTFKKPSFLVSMFDFWGVVALINAALKMHAETYV